LDTRESNWRKFVIFGEEDINVRKPVIDSWNRSKQSDVSHEENRILPFTEKKEWLEREQKSQTLLRAAKPTMYEIFSTLRGGGYQVVLTDAQGYILGIMADKEAEAASSRIGISKGVRWLEKHVGTTGLTIALKTRSAMVTSGAEHFCMMLWNWDCAAAPIFVNHQFTGVLNICRLTLGDGLQEFLSVAISGARTISQQMQIEALQMKERTLSDLLSLSEQANHPTGILAFNKEGRLVYNNRAAHDFLHPLRKEKNLLDLTNPNQLLEGRSIHAKDAKDNETTHFIFEESGKEFVIESKECRSDEEITSTVLFIHPKHQSKGRVVSYESSPILSSFPTKEEGFKKILNRAVKIAKSDACILLQGESGTGKDYMARAIHRESGRKSRPFIAINCASLPGELISSELFGYGPGAFTGANRNGNVGKIEAANGGTLFLDEIGDMPLDLQAILLRTLEDNQVTRIGCTKPVAIDVRFIAATHKNLKELVKSGEFREDLYYRLSVFPLHLPPLRERRADLEQIIKGIMVTLSQKAGRAPILLTPNAIKMLQNYPWNGNLRELRNVIERMVQLHESDVIDIEHLGDYMDLSREDGKLDEKGLLLSALERTSGNRAKAARELGISRAALYRKLERYGL
jgi:sigma-54 dependent transcriptional regulator, acetoin dehydrogenase operon transcriptional activator AcoR